MKRLVSKVRARKTRSRERKASRPSVLRIPLKENPLIGFLIGLAVWLLVTVMLFVDPIIRNGVDVGLVFSFLGDGVFLLIILFVVVLLLNMVRPGLIQDNAKVLLIGLIAVLSLLPVPLILYLANHALLLRAEVAGFLLPFAMGPLLATILIDKTAGAALGSWTSLVIAMMAGRSLPLFVTGMVATVVTAETARILRTRFKVFRTGLVIGLSQITCVFALTAMEWQAPDVMLVVRRSAACLFSGFFSAVAVLLILPLFESCFHLATDITLLELSDLGHPLLQRLAIEAPGTYHHSLVVANIAQAAADEIGANPMLARVMAYYHDIGKLTKPEFYAENFQIHQSPHDSLPPSMSTLVITAHVKEGLSLGMVHKLPPPLLSAIQEHHGTSLITSFYHKALTQLQEERGRRSGNGAGDRQRPDEGDFRYPGPLPSTKESAIVCLADSVEAASRCMEKPTPANVEELVADLVNRRILDGQLDACGLTMAELRKIKRSFSFTLMNMLHGRVPYPRDEDRDSEPPETGDAGQTEAPGAGPASDGERESA